MIKKVIGAFVGALLMMGAYYYHYVGAHARAFQQQQEELYRELVNDR